MNQDEIIEMARQVGPKKLWKQLEAFAKLVAAAEREACAKVCEDESVPHHAEIHSDAQWAAKILAGKIRARGGEVLASPIIKSYLEKDNLEEDLYNLAIKADNGGQP